MGCAHNIVGLVASCHLEGSGRALSILADEQGHEDMGLLVEDSALIKDCTSSTMFTSRPYLDLHSRHYADLDLCWISLGQRHVHGLDLTQREARGRVVVVVRASPKEGRRQLRRLMLRVHSGWLRTATHGRWTWTCACSPCILYIHVLYCTGISLCWDGQTLTTTPYNVEVYRLLIGNSPPKGYALDCPSPSKPRLELYRYMYGYAGNPTAYTAHHHACLDSLIP